MLVREPEGQRPIRRPWRGWENKIIMDLGEMVLACVEWKHLALNREQWAGACEHGNEPLGSVEGGEFQD